MVAKYCGSVRWVEGSWMEDGRKPWVTGLAELKEMRAVVEGGVEVMEELMVGKLLDRMMEEMVHCGGGR